MQNLGSVTQSWSADVGGLSVMGGQNRAGTGSASVTVHGASMGLVTYTGRAREGHTGCEATEWESETSVRCLVSEGGGGGTRRVTSIRWNLIEIPWNGVWSGDFDAKSSNWTYSMRSKRMDIRFIDKMQSIDKAQWDQTYNSVSR